jgi:hypothetical protein
MAGVSSIHEFLREAHVPYTVMPHRPAFTAQEESAATHVPVGTGPKSSSALLTASRSRRCFQRRGP